MIRRRSTWQPYGRELARAEAERRILVIAGSATIAGALSVTSVLLALQPFAQIAAAL